MVPDYLVNLKFLEIKHIAPVNHFSSILPVFLPGQSQESFFEVQMYQKNSSGCIRSPNIPGIKHEAGNQYVQMLIADLFLDPYAIVPGPADNSFPFSF